MELDPIAVATLLFTHPMPFSNLLDGTRVDGGDRVRKVVARASLQPPRHTNFSQAGHRVVHHDLHAVGAEVDALYAQAHAGGDERPLVL
jgi:hypothetical protein